MARMVIDDKLWDQLEALLPDRTKKGGRPENDRLFIEAVCWVIRTGAPHGGICHWHIGHGKRFTTATIGGVRQVNFIDLKKRWRSRMAHD